MQGEEMEIVVVAGGGAATPSPRSKAGKKQKKTTAATVAPTAETEGAATADRPETETDAEKAKDSGRTTGDDDDPKVTGPGAVGVDQTILKLGARLAHSARVKPQRYSKSYTQFSRSQRLNHRKLVDTYKLAAVPFPDFVQKAEEEKAAAMAISGCAKPAVASSTASGQGGGGGSSSSTQSSQGGQQQTGGGAQKRQRQSADDTPGKTVPKKRRDVVGAGETMYILCSGKLEVTPKQATAIQKYIVSSCRTVTARLTRGETPWIPVFTKIGLGPGHVAVTPADEPTFNWLVDRVQRAPSIWEGCSLELIPYSELPRRRTLEGVIPSPAPEKASLVQQLATQNPKLSCENWALRGFSPNYHGTFVRFELTEDSFALLSTHATKTEETSKTPKGFSVYEGGRFFTLHE